jgi:hypothetical protein
MGTINTIENRKYPKLQNPKLYGFLILTSTTNSGNSTRRSSKSQCQFAHPWTSSYTERVSSHSTVDHHLSQILADLQLWFCFQKWDPDCQTLYFAVTITLRVATKLTSRWAQKLYQQDYCIQFTHPCYKENASSQSLTVDPCSSQMPTCRFLFLVPKVRGTVTEIVRLYIS